MIMTGRLPFEGTSRREVFAKIHSGDYNASGATMSDACHDFIGCMLKVNSSDRYSAAQLLKHPWITNRQNSTS